MNAADNRRAFLFIAPSIMGVAMFYAAPFVISLAYAVTGADGSFVWFENFIKLFKSDAFRLAAGNTLTFMAIAIPLNIAIPFLIGFTLYKKRFLPKRSAIRRTRRGKDGPSISGA